MNFGCGAAIEFWYWAAANCYRHLKKNLTITFVCAIPARFPLQPR